MFWQQTPRSTVLALRGVRDRREQDMKNALSIAWLQGQLSQIDLKHYPKLEEVTGEGQEKKVAADSGDDAGANAGAWIAALKGLNRAG